MFSDHVPQLHVIPAKAWLTLSAGAAFAGLLLAFCMVANGQVTAAEQRESRLVVQRLAVSQCVESSNGAERKACIALIPDGTVNGTGAPLPLEPVRTSLRSQDLRDVAPVGDLSGIIQVVSFQAHR